MKNSERYNFSDFTTNNYKRLLAIAKDRYVFKNFSDYQGANEFILWRHDIDFSIHRAAKIARIEAEMGVKATYYVLLHSEFYNLLEKEISMLLNQIIELGHEIGLHFDSHYYNIKSESELENKLLFEKKILDDVFGVNIKTFSFHITNNFTINCNKSLYARMVNAFSKEFQKDISYCSDSNGYWRHQRLEDFLLNPPSSKLQVLTHPELWQDEIMSPKQRVNRCVNLRAEKTKNWYNETLKTNGRENIDWE